MAYEYKSKRPQKLPNHFYHATLDEVAQELGVTRERVRQIEIQALKKIATKLKLAGITEDDLYMDEDIGF